MAAAIAPTCSAVFVAMEQEAVVVERGMIVDVG